MMHCTEDELFELALKVSEEKELSDFDKKRLKHIQQCRECYENFCVALALCDATSADGLAMAVQQEKAEQARQMEQIRVLSVVEIMRKKLSDTKTAVMEQLYSENAQMIFEPAISFAARGKEGSASEHMIKLEELDDEKTYIMFDAKKNELYVQVHLKGFPEEKICLYLIYEDGKIMELPVVIEGRFAKGHITEVPEGDFQIYIASATTSKNPAV